MSSSLYTQLKTKQSTRLVRVLPGEAEAILNLEFSEVDLDDKPIYDAVSYTWGDNRDLFSIVVNAEPVLVRRNLIGFLLRLRSQSYGGEFWVDAISIRQDDPIEKSQQVGMIGRVFESAQKVLVWVGEHSNDSETLFDNAAPPGRGPSPQSRDNKERRVWTWLNFIQRPYWKRLWILQELILAKEIIVHCGDSALRWQGLMRHRSSLLKGIIWDGIELNRLTGAAFESFRHQIQDLLILMQMRRLRKPTSIRGFLDVVSLEATHRAEVQEIGHLSVRFRGHNCSDRRDYMYALLSLDKNRELRSFYPDYTIDEAELFVRLCLARLLAWPRSWSEYLKGYELAQQTLFVARLDRRLLHQRVLFHKAVNLVVDMYKDQATSRRQRSVLAIIAADLKSSEWSSDKWSMDNQHRLSCIRHRQEKVLHKSFREIIDRELIWRIG